LRSILVYPAIGLCGFGKRRSAFTGNGEVDWCHHGIGMIGTYARSKGFDIDIFDLRDLNNWGEFEYVMQKEQFDVVGVSVSYVDYKVAMQVIDIIRRVSPSSKIVAGGFVANLFPQVLVDNPKIDYVISGEGEIAFSSLLRLIEHGMTTDKLIVGVRPDLDKLPFVDRTLFNYERETTCFFGPRQRFPHITMLAGRGCPYQCGYCQPAESKTYGKMRIRSVDNVIEELKVMRDRYKFKSITFWDDTFTFNKKWVMEFCDKFEQNGFDADLAITCRADIASNNEDMMKRLSEIGVQWVCIGFETGTQRMLDFIGKGVKLEQNYKSAEICRKYGMKIMGTNMLGLPTETKEESQATIDMIQRVAAEHLQLFYFTPVPGTYLYDYCINHNLMIREVKDMFDIERSVCYTRNIRDIDYNYLDGLKKQINYEGWYSL
jgi:anaerobic magnesium-protoporphyrin IX monomethyl ester cyclase